MNETTANQGARGRSLGNVLVASDFSAGASQAVGRALRLPIGPSSAITILHVLPGKPAPRVEGAVRRALAEQAAAARRAAREAGLKDVDVVTYVARGKPFVEIIGFARQTKAQLIVLGRHGQGTFRDLVLGSTAERVIRKGATPVLVVRSRAARPYQRPLVAVDGSETCRRAFELTLRVADPGVRAIDIVHAYGVPYEGTLGRTGLPEKDLRKYRLETKNAARALVDAFVASREKDAPPLRLSLRRGDPRQVILHVAALRRSDLLALGTHGRSGLAQALIGSVAEAVVRAAPCDVLVARPTGFVFTLP